MKIRVFFAIIITVVLLLFGMFFSANLSRAQSYLWSFTSSLEGWTGDVTHVGGEMRIDSNGYAYSPPMDLTQGERDIHTLRWRGPTGSYAVFCDGVKIYGWHDFGGSSTGITHSWDGPTTCAGDLTVQLYSYGAYGYVDWFDNDLHTDPTPTPTATPTAPDCDTVQNHDFEDTSAWNLYFSATITNSELTLPASGIAAQAISGLESNTTYNVNLAVSQSVTNATVITTTLGTSPDSVTITSAGTYTTTVNTGAVSGPQNFSITNGGPDTVLLDWVCLTKPTGATTGQCIAPINGTFENNTTGWDLYRGAAHNSASQALYLPFTGAGETESGAATSQDSYQLPTASGGEYLIYQYTARALQDTGLTMIGAWTPDQASEYYSYVEVYPQDYTYQFDISSLAGQTVELGVNNPGFDPLTGITKEGDVIIDNICVLLSTTPPQLPSPTNPNQYTPVTLGDWYSCSDVDSLVWSYIGVDLRYHRANYDSGASAWDPAGWVPWLISAMWVMASTIVCFLLMMVQTIINLIEYLINNILNIFDWLYSNWQQLPALATAWLLAGLDSFANFAQVAWQSAKNLAEWFGNSMWELIYSIPEIVTNMGTVADWTGAAIIWLWEAIVVFGDWLIANGWNLLIWLYNNMGSLLQLLFLSLAGPFGTLIYIIILIWNNLAIFIDWLAGVMGYETLPEAIGSTLLAIFELFSASFKYLYAYLIDAASAPQALLTALMNGVQAGSFGALLGCSGDGSFWCGFLTGLDIVNISYGHTIFYPIVIVTITIATLFILKREFANLLWTVLDYVFKI